MRSFLHTFAHWKNMGTERTCLDARQSYFLHQQVEGHDRCQVGLLKLKLVCVLACMFFGL